MIKIEPLFSLRDVSIIPAVTTSINTREECNPKQSNLEKTDDCYYPVITAPMSCVLRDLDVVEEFDLGRINTIIPRTFPLEERWKLCKTRMTAFSLSEAKNIYCNQDESAVEKINILLDMANGHMHAQLEIGRLLRNKFGSKLVLMGGNIANPHTYLDYERAGFDYVRCGIGGGAGCLTSTQLGVHYPMGSLISGISEIKKSISGKCKIVADGGIGCYSDIIKSLALGADYVMMGQVFTKAALSGEIIGDTVDYYGMSTKVAQKEMGSTKLKTSEGKKMQVLKEYTLSGWTENLRDYLRSAMSYCDSRTLEEFREKAVCSLITPNSANLINDK